MAKYTKEEKQKAIDLYIRYCRQATKVIWELGYPNERHTLVSWYRGYEEKGEVKDDGREEKKLFTLARVKSGPLQGYLLMDMDWGRLVHVHGLSTKGAGERSEGINIMAIDF